MSSAIAKIEPSKPVREPRDPVQVRDQIAGAGSIKFTPDPACEDGVCLTCRGFAEPNKKIDAFTGLGPICWVGWRWGFNRENGVAGAP
jgi:hypothetical protein